MRKMKTYLVWDKTKGMESAAYVEADSKGKAKSIYFNQFKHSHYLNVVLKVVNDSNLIEDADMIFQQKDIQRVGD